MPHEPVDQAVREIFAAVVQREVAPGADVAREEEPAWDSLKHMEMMFAIEERCGVQFTQEELGGLDRISAIVERVKSHLGES